MPDRTYDLGIASRHLDWGGIPKDHDVFRTAREERWRVPNRSGAEKWVVVSRK
jgi:hypothetical protein